ncbi:hypothetical protein ACH5RR_017692 [Cinchona calisaya]|uniref:Integrase catalytic domain-containing protein n=1 Tax=Cinchona calisaya TaxID=153742 RepID=A0ABD2ZP99_9GENT
MKKSEMVKDLPDFEVISTDCHVCQYRKQSRLPFPTATWRATKKLQLIHTDVGSLQRTPSLKEVGSTFWKYKAKVENESGCKIQILRSDNGKEYNSHQFNSFCEEAGIEHQLTAPYTPEKNGVSERRNRFIMEMARCMLHEKNLPKEF